jgi:hypothetical protein
METKLFNRIGKGSQREISRIKKAKKNDHHDDGDAGVMEANNLKLIIHIITASCDNLSEKLAKPLTNTIKRIPNKRIGFDFR